MAIKYALFDNKMLHSEANEYIARTKAVGTADLEAVISRMGDMGTTVSKADILAVFEDMTAAAESLLLDGFNVDFDGFCNFRCSVKGVFGSADDSFDPARHSIEVNASTGLRIRKSVRNNAQPAKTEPIIPAPFLAEFVDTATASVNHTITPGNIGTINGSRLKFDQAADDEGIFLTADSAEQMKVSSTAKNKPAQLVFLIPQPEPGITEFQLELRTRMSVPDGELKVSRLADRLVL